MNFVIKLCVLRGKKNSVVKKTMNTEKALSSQRKTLFLRELCVNPLCTPWLKKNSVVKKTMNKKRTLFIIIAVVSLMLLYLFQRFNYAFYVSESFSSNTQFIINRTIRFFLNDLAVILLIYAIFNNKQLLKIAFGIQLIEMLIILPLYFYFKLSIEGASEISSPLLSFIHRIVVNPIIMLLLIPGFWFQQNSLPR